MRRTPPLSFQTQFLVKSVIEEARRHPAESTPMAQSVSVPVNWRVWGQKRSRPRCKGFSRTGLVYFVGSDNEALCKRTPPHDSNVQAFWSGLVA